MTAPEILRVILKEHGVELTAIAVDIKILQTVLGQFVDQGGQIAEAYLHGGEKAEVFEGFHFQGNGVVVKAGIKVDPGDAVPGEHHTIFLLRVGASFDKGHGPA